MILSILLFLFFFLLLFFFVVFFLCSCFLTTFFLTLWGFSISSFLAGSLTEPLGKFLCWSLGPFFILNTVHQSSGTMRKVLEFEHSSRSVPYNKLCPGNDVSKKLSRFWATIQTHPSVRNSLLYGGSSYSRILGKLVSCDKVYWEVELNVLGFSFLHQLGHNFGTFLIIQRCSNTHVVIYFSECEGHTTSDYHFINFVKHVFNQLNLVSNFCSSENGKEWFLRVVQSL